MHQHEDVEELLRQFRPRQPAPWRAGAPRRSATWWLAAAATLAIAGLGVAAVGRSIGDRDDGGTDQPRPMRDVTSGALHRDALRGPERFEAALESAERHTMPAADGLGALLRTLAND